MRSPLLAALVAATALAFPRVGAAADAAGPASAAAPSDRTCLAVFGHGRNRSDTDARVNEQWNRVNAAFNQAVDEALRPAGRPTVTFLLPVEGRDFDAMFSRLMKLAGAERCDTLVETSMYADQARHAFVSRVTVHLVVAQHDAATDSTRYVVGRQLFDRERSDPLTKETLDTLSPTDAARELVGAWLASPDR